MSSKIKYIGRVITVYLCVLTPVILVSVLLTHRFLCEAEKREEQMLLRNLQDIVIELDSWYDSFQSQASALGEKIELSPSLLIDNTIKEIEAVDLLELTNLFNNYTSEIVVYYGVGKLYSSSGLMSIPVYFDTKLKCSPKSIEEAEAALSATASSTVFLRADEGRDVLMYHYPLKRVSSKHTMSVQFIVPMEHFERALEIYSSNCQMLFKMTLGDEMAYYHVIDRECTTLLPEEFSTLQIEYEHVLRQEVASTGMELELYFNPEISWKEFESFRNINIMLLAVGIFLSVLLSFFISRYRWGRFETLSRIIKVKNDTEERPKPYTDEFDYMQVVMEQSIKESEQLAKNMHDYRHGMIRQTAIMVFHGMINKTEDIRQILHSCNLELQEEFYYMCGILVYDENFDIRSVEDLFENHLYAETLVNDQKVLLFLAESSDADQKCSRRFDATARLCQNLRSGGTSVGRVVMSQMHDQLSMVNYAYLEVVSLLENPLQPDEQIACWDNYQHIFHDKLTPSQSEYLQLYIEALANRNIQMAEKALDGMLDKESGEEGADSEKIQYYLRYCIRQAMILAVRGNEFEVDSSLMNQVMRINPIDENHFVNQILKILRTYCSDNMQSEKVEVAVEYVKKNYNRYDLSLEDVAACVGISKTQMSKLFKSQLGIGYLDFLTKLRLHKAQELLANTDQTVKSILLEVGYVDKTSFTKKFKANFGITPTEYRSQIRDDLMKDGIDE